MEDIFNNKRLEGESIEDYKARRKANQKALKERSGARMYWPSVVGGTFTKEKAAQMARRILEKEGKFSEGEIENERTDT